MPKLDIFGNHAKCCFSASGGPRREFWHDDLVSLWLHLARFAGCKVVHEKSGIVVAQPNFRADLYFPQLKYIIDLRTAVTCDKTLCLKAAVTPGAAAEAGTAKKDDKWKAPVEAQGDTFIAPVHEEGGRISEPALNLLDSFARRFGNTNIEQATYKTYALQRLHTVGQIGVARLYRCAHGKFQIPSQPYASASLLGARWAWHLHLILRPLVLFGKLLLFIGYRRRPWRMR
jgi:hypothetical protein